ncbi:hypothetical protein 44RRORF016c [Aeromonas phage 44RR2.8t]|uniref:Uncharacterized protein n=2 Tax=Biquartavirus 44RR2 TaxID=115987 RepID=Q6U9T6_9CAUD|nr:hypothetical protein ST44RRORF016c [Aeromonas phage 44RR2.8t]AAQ81335.1 hypothetical protein 44RRORF016c [Aeromonas phage 44RR2.8t]APU00488.1 hypothetical protein [Aeromonas phage 44RR2.8t.2]
MKKHLRTLPIKEVVYEVITQHPLAEGPIVETDGRMTSVYFSVDIPEVGYVFFDKVYDSKSKNPRYDYCISYDKDCNTQVQKWLDENVLKK